MPETADRQNDAMAHSRGTAVVTGASSGIGAATARRLAVEGFEVIACARRADRLTELSAGVPKITPMVVDVTSQDSVDDLAASVGADLALLVNNAGGAIGLDPVAKPVLRTGWRCMRPTCWE